MTAKLYFTTKNLGNTANPKTLKLVMADNTLKTLLIVKFLTAASEAVFFTDYVNETNQELPLHCECSSSN